MPALTRGQKILALVAVLIVALYVTGVATQQGSTGKVDPTENGLVKMLGRWFGSPDQAEPGELSAPCLAQQQLTIKDSCVLTVASSDKDLREVVLRAQQPVRLHTRAPHDDSFLDKDLTAGEEVKVTVDSSGGDVTLTCSSCVVLVGE
ncbi:hypothetical protein Rhe02_02000 [Rhizocola hellebori]|uniref:Uncharacterized protein n=1 Tax=Rhizocola hellebori TaxID=1392758 RepID=A0A8J3Q1M1_9ACTN|nr:hypothetical protein [Rhizocola hellebori]GIH02133.1 hypothetical protein Rhe02_02000 [Rhizocola hellebori]